MECPLSCAKRETGRRRRGKLAERVRTLRTTNRSEALGRRPAALEAIRQEIDAKLIQAGFPPLQGEWRPDWAVEQSDMVAEALEARRELGAASETPDQSEELPNNRVIRTSPKDRLRDTIVDVISDRAIDMNEAGQDGDAYFKNYTEIAFAEATPIGELLDRWFRDIEGTLKKQTISMSHLSFRLLGEFLISVRRAAQTDGTAFIRSTMIESLRRRDVSGFSEWLAQERKLSVKTIAGRISPLKSFWDWVARKGYTEFGANPWTGATAGLKKRIRVSDVGKQEKGYAEADLVALLTADPDAGRRWKYGSAIHDLLRIGLLTGARQNELCSLTRSRIVPPQTHEGALWALMVTPDVGKTENASRLVPLHPFVQPIIARRLAEADPDGDALLFPELPPGGPDNKMSWVFSKRFGDFRKFVLGAEDTHDFHDLRRTFMTYFALAAAKGAQGCTTVIRDRLVGHASAALGDRVYVGDLGREVSERAILETVDKGMPDQIKAILQTEDTAQTEKGSLPEEGSEETDSMNKEAA